MEMHNMKRIRMEQGLSLRALSERSGVSMRQLARIENMESDPTYTTMQKIAWGLRKEVWQVFEEQK